MNSPQASLKNPSPWDELIAWIHKKPKLVGFFSNFVAELPSRIVDIIIVDPILIHTVISLIADILESNVWKGAQEYYWADGKIITTKDGYNITDDKINDYLDKKLLSLMDYFSETEIVTIKWILLVMREKNNTYWVRNRIVRAFKLIFEK